MRDSPWKDLAHGALFLCSMRKAVRRRWLSWKRWKALLQRGLLWHVRSKMWRLQPSHHGKLHLGFEQSMASGLLRLQGRDPWNKFITFFLTFQNSLDLFGLPVLLELKQEMLFASWLYFVVECYWTLRYRIARRPSLGNHSMPWRGSQFVQSVLELMMRRKKKKRKRKLWRKLSNNAARTLILCLSIAKLYPMPSAPTMRSLPYFSWVIGARIDDYTSSWVVLFITRHHRQEF